MLLHLPTRSPGETIEEDAQKVIYADKIGFDEAFFGEHTSCRTEPIAAQLTFLASVLRQTKQIKSAPA